MKAFILTLCICCVSTGNMYGQTNFFKEEFPDVWMRTKAYTMEVAATMPQARYQFKPAQGNLTFAELMIHIVENIEFISNGYLSEGGTNFKKLDPKTNTKDEIMAEMEAAFDYVYQLIEEIPEAELKTRITFARTEISRENAFYIIRNHTTHHRGQAAMYLTMNGFDAPNYRGW